MTGRAAITVDLDGIDCYRSIHGLSARSPRPDTAYHIGVRRLLDFLSELDYPATLFVIGEDVEKDEGHYELLCEAHQRGHELANHSYFHDYELRHKTRVLLEEDIRLGEEAIRLITGHTPSGFRAPGYNVDDTIVDVLVRRGYRYDSSVFPCPPYWFAKAGVMGWLELRGRPSRSSMTRADTLLAPIAPYQMGRPFWRRGGGLWQIPMALIPGVRFPLIGTSLHLLGESGFDLALPAIRRAYPKLFQLEFHAIDFMDACDPGVEDLVGKQPDLDVPWTVKRARYAHIFRRLQETYRFTTLENAVAWLDAY